MSALLQQDSAFAARVRAEFIDALNLLSAAISAGGRDISNGEDHKMEKLDLHFWSKVIAMTESHCWRRTMVPILNTNTSRTLIWKSSRDILDSGKDLEWTKKSFKSKGWGSSAKKMLDDVFELRLSLEIKGDHALIHGVIALLADNFPSITLFEKGVAAAWQLRVEEGYETDDDRAVADGDPSSPVHRKAKKRKSLLNTKRKKIALPSQILSTKLWAMHDTTIRPFLNNRTLLIEKAKLLGALLNRNAFLHCLNEDFASIVDVPPPPKSCSTHYIPPSFDKLSELTTKQILRLHDDLLWVQRCLETVISSEHPAPLLESCRATHVKYSSLFGPVPPSPSSLAGYVSSFVTRDFKFMVGTSHAHPPLPELLSVLTPPPSFSPLTLLTP